MGKLIKADGTEAPYPRKGSSYSLAELQVAVGGYIEIVALGGSQLMVLNDDGKRHGLHPNLKATSLARGVIAASDYVVGDVVVCAKGEVD